MSFNNLTNRISKLLNKQETIRKISSPTNFLHLIHVEHDSGTGDLQGLPDSWEKNLKVLETQNNNGNDLSDAIRGEVDLKECEKQSDNVMTEPVIIVVDTSKDDYQADSQDMGHVNDEEEAML